MIPPRSLPPSQPARAAFAPSPAEKAVADLRSQLAVHIALAGIVTLILVGNLAYLAGQVGSLGTIALAAWIGWLAWLVLVLSIVSWRASSFWREWRAFRFPGIARKS